MMNGIQFLKLASLKQKIIRAGLIHVFKIVGFFKKFVSQSITNQLKQSCDTFFYQKIRKVSANSLWAKFQTVYPHLTRYYYY